MRLTTILIFLCALSSDVLALTSDSLIVLSPEQLFTLIDEQSTSLKINTLTWQQAQQDVKEAKNAWLPSITASWELGYLGDGYLTDRDFSSGMHVKNPHFVNNFTLEAMQMIYSGGAVQNGIKIAKLKSRMADISIDENRSQLRFILLSKLIDINCLRKQLEVLDRNIDLARDVLKQMQIRAAEGLVLENDITRYELQIADLQLRRNHILEQINVDNTNVATTLGLPTDSQFSLDTKSIDENYPLPPLSQWLDEAQTQNPMIAKARVGIDISNTGLRLANAQKLPQIGAYAYGCFNSPITIEVPVINKNFMFWGFGLNISYNLSSLFKSSASISKARIGVWESKEKLRLAEEQTIDRITKAYHSFITACSNLHTLKSSLKLAEQNYAVVNSRFDEGMALITDLVDAANVKIAAQTGVENAKSRLLFCLYNLKFISNTL